MEKTQGFLKSIAGTITAMLTIGAVLVGINTYVVQQEMTELKEETLAPIEYKIDVLSQDTYRNYIGDVYSQLIRHETVTDDCMELALIYCYNYVEVFDGNSETKHKCDTLQEFSTARIQ